MLPTIRPFQAQDAKSVVETVREVFEEYGFTWNESGYFSDLRDPQAHYVETGGAFWVGADPDGEVTACVGLLPHAFIPGLLGQTAVVDGKVRAAATDCSLERLYVRPCARRLGLGTALTNLVRTEAAHRNYRGIELWSDKKLVDAHRLYEGMGAMRIGDRVCDDPDQSAEWGFVFRVD